MAHDKLTESDWNEIITDARDDAGLDSDAGVPEDLLAEHAGKRFFEVADDARARVKRAVAKDWLARDDGQYWLAGNRPGQDDEERSELDSEENDAPDESDSDEPTVSVDRALAAMNVACRYYHEQLDRDLAGVDDVEVDTPREYFAEVRGWSDDLIAEKMVGWAPADGEALMVHLHEQGFSREEMLATGLFGENDDGNLYTMWQGRYVIPYIYDGEPVFAISRDSGHPADWKDGKYDKPLISRDNVPLKEPICGLDSIEEGEPTVITEGIADAYTLHDQGVSAISPVTTQFSGDAQERLVRVLDDYEIDRVFILQDSEEPNVARLERDDPSRITDVLSIEQHGHGIKGAVKTGEYLADRGIEARVGTPPRPGGDKMDVDDYVQELDGNIRPLAASAKPAGDHPAASEEARKNAAREQSRRERNRHEDSDTDSDDHQQSRLWDLTLRDVTGLSEGDRLNNPLGHHGSREDYFVVISDELAYEHKYKVAYNALTYILCEAGVRHPSAPEGPLSRREVWEAWKHAKEERYIPASDPIPWAAIRHVADEHNIGPLFNDYGLDAVVFNATLSRIENEYGTEVGRDRLGSLEDQRKGEAKADGNDELEDAVDELLG